MRLHRALFAPIAILALGLAGCDRRLGPETAAEVADFELGIEDAAQLLAPISALPNDPGVVQTTLDFWVDYTLLAWAVNEPGELEALDISAIVEQEVSRQLVLRLREQVIEVDTIITDEELRAAFEDQRPGEEIRARHILVSIPLDATSAQQDSLRALAEELRDRARSGEDFGGLAEQYSQDPGSAIQGGDLGFFGRGMMVPPFEEAAFALAPGEVSDVVQTSFGLHVILVEERRGPSFDDIAEDYRVQLQAEREMVAESTYLADLEAPANVQIAEGAIELVRRITTSPEEGLSGRDASRPLATWEGGLLEAEEYREFVSGQPREIRQQISVAQDQQVQTLLRDLARDRLLVAEVERMGIEATGEEEATARSEVLNQYVLIADFLGVDSLQVEEGSTVREAVEVQVMDLMGRLVSNQQDIIPLGVLGLPLRARYQPRVADDALERIVARVTDLRLAAGRPAAPAPTQPLPPQTPAPEESPEAAGPGP